MKGNKIGRKIKDKIIDQIIDQADVANSGVDENPLNITYGANNGEDS